MAKNVISSIDKELIQLNKLFSLEVLPSDYFLNFENILEKVIINGINSKGYLSLVIKYLSKLNNHDELVLVVNQFSSNLRKNDFLVLMSYYENNALNCIKSKEYFDKHYDKYYFDSKSIKFLIQNNLRKFLINLDGYFTEVDDFLSLKKLSLVEQVTNFEQLQLKIYQVNSCLIDEYIKILGESISFLNSKLIFDKIYELNSSSLIIDGGNVLHHLDGKIGNDSYILLLNIIRFIISIDIYPILVIHNKHVNKKRKNEICSNIIDNLQQLVQFSKLLIVETPYSESDDLYILTLSLKFQTKILTNDKFGNHIQNIKKNFINEKVYKNQIEFFIKDLLVKYDMKGKSKVDSVKSKLSNLNLKYSKPSKCIQVREINGKKEIFIPNMNCQFYKLI